MHFGFSITKHFATKSCVSWRVLVSVDLLSYSLIAQSNELQVTLELFFSTYRWDQNLRVETLSIRGQSEGRRITTLLPSCYFWIWLAFLPLHTPSFFPSPQLLHAFLQAHTNTLTYSEAQARATAGLKPEDLNSASSLPAGFVLWNQSELGRTSSLSIVSGWNLATRLWLSINFFCALCKLGWI